MSGRGGTKITPHECGHWGPCAATLATSHVNPSQFLTWPPLRVLNLCFNSTLSHTIHHTLYSRVSHSRICMYSFIYVINSNCNLYNCIEILQTYWSVITGLLKIIIMNSCFLCVLSSIKIFTANRYNISIFALQIVLSRYEHTKLYHSYITKQGF